jgi:lipoprotein Spr
VTIDYAARAAALVGARFRPQGRSPDALDCVGLVLSTFDIPAVSAPHGYRLRGDHRHAIELELAKNFRRISRNQLRPGDVMLLGLSADQFHLAVRTPAGFVHAHAGIGAVVETPGRPQWPVLAVYRKRRSR